MLAPIVGREREREVYFLLEVNISCCSILVKERVSYKGTQRSALQPEDRKSVV